MKFSTLSTSYRSRQKWKESLDRRGEDFLLNRLYTAAKQQTDFILKIMIQTPTAILIQMKVQGKVNIVMQDQARPEGNKDFDI